MSLIFGCLIHSQCQWTLRFGLTSPTKCSTSLPLSSLPFPLHNFSPLAILCTSLHPISHPSLYLLIVWFGKSRREEEKKRTTSMATPLCDSPMVKHCHPSLSSQSYKFLLSLMHSLWNPISVPHLSINLPSNSDPELLNWCILQNGTRSLLLHLEVF